MTAARLAVVVAAVAVAACQDPPAQRTAAGTAAGSGPADAAAPGTAGSAAGSAAVQHGPPKVIVMDEPPIVLPRQESFRLLDPGKGARSPLRYTLAARTSAVMARLTLTSRHLEHGNFTAPEALPVIRDGFAVTGADHGRLALRAVPRQATKASPLSDAYLAAGRSFENRGISLEVDDRGGLAAFHFDDDPSGVASAAAHDVLAQSLLTLVVPVPDEPVGRGASWRVVSILRQGPATIKQTATYTLLAREPKRWRLHVKQQRVGENQSIVDPSLPRGTAIELIALFRVLEGDIEVEPALPLIAGGAMTLESRLHVKTQLPPAPGAGSQAAPPAAIEQMVEDTGRISFARCRPAPAEAVAPREPAGQLADCAPGYVRAP